MAIFLENLTDLLECAVCTEELSDPRILTCFHSFCLTCIRDIVKNKNACSVSCPTCRKKTNIPQKDVNKLPVDFRTVQMKQLASGAKRRRIAFCDVCSSVKQDKIGLPAVSYCSECAFLFCKNCLTEHSNSKLTSSHTTWGLSDEVAESIAACKLHSNLASWFCLTCKEGLCFACTLAKEHSGHNVQPPKTAFDELATKLDAGISVFKTKCIDDEPEKEIERLKAEQSTVKQHCQEVGNIVKAHSAAIVTKVQTKEEKMLQTIKDFEDEYKQQSSDFISRLEKVSKYPSAFAESRNGNNCDVKAVFTQSQLVDEVTTLSKDMEEKELSATPLPHFTSENSLNIGKIEIERSPMNDTMIVNGSTVAETGSIDNDPVPSLVKNKETVNAIIRRTFTNITNMPIVNYSPKLLVNGLHWCIMLKVSVENDKKYLAMYLRCDKSLLSGRQCVASGKIVLVNQAGMKDKNVTRQLNDKYTHITNSWGYSKFISLQELLDVKNGYVKNNEIIVEIQMDVTKPVKVQD